MDAHAGRISHYRVLDELGRDRLGYVLRAQDEQLDRPVVLRIVRAASVYPAARIEAIRATFQSEAKRAARVSHPNLATIYAFQPIDDVDLIATEQVEGTSLRALLALGERWRVPDAARLGARVADAVAAAHAAGMTHGRLTLANVFVRPDGRVKVLDLGIPGVPPEEPDGDVPVVPPQPANRADDIYALALITLELAATATLPPGALWRQIDAEPAAVAALLTDETQARRRYGVLAPVVRRAVASQDGMAYADAGEYRDALLAALVEPAQGVDDQAADEPEADLGPGTPLVVPRGPPISDADDALEDVGPGQGAEPESDRAPRLVLTADLAKGGRPPPPDADRYVVMTPGGLGARLREARGPIGGGRRLVIPDPRVSRRALLRTVVLLLVLAAAGLTAWGVRSTDGGVDALLAQAEPIAARVRDRVRDVVNTREPAATPDPDPLEVRPPTVDSPGRGVGADTNRTGATRPDDAAAVSSAITPTSREPSAAAEMPLREPSVDAATPSSVAGLQRTAMVRAGPPGTSIRVDGRSGVWQDDVVLSVADGDSLIVRFEKPGHVAQTHMFKGSRLSVALRPDSVTVRFAANLPADVYIEYADGARSRIGTTDFWGRLPAGTHRFAFVAPNQPEWSAAHRMTRAGATYRVEKLDYVTEGSLVATTTPTWAWISLDGGPPRETPVSLEGLSVGTHKIVVTRDGFEPIADSVVIRPGYIVTKRYTLARGR